MARMLPIILEPINLVLSTATTLTRFWAGWPGRAPARRPEQPLIFYEFEGCPFCRIAREAVSGLRLTAEFRPCPKAGTRYRPALIEIGGKAQFPYMIDPNTDTAMYESADITRYLYRTYGGRMSPLSLWLGPFNAALSSLGLALRAGSGVRNRNRRTEVAQPLAIWGSEADPRARLLREVLCELEIPYIRHGDRSGSGAAIALHDPNTGRTVEGSLAARTYLLDQYP